MFIQSSDFKNAVNSAGTLIEKGINNFKIHGGHAWKYIKDLPYNIYSDHNFRLFGKPSIIIKDKNVKLDFVLDFENRFKQKNCILETSGNNKNILKLHRHDPTVFLERIDPPPFLSAKENIFTAISLKKSKQLREPFSTLLGFIRLMSAFVHVSEVIGA